MSVGITFLNDIVLIVFYKEFTSTVRGVILHNDDVDNPKAETAYVGASRHTSGVLRYFGTSLLS